MSCENLCRIREELGFCQLHSMHVHFHSSFTTNLCDFCREVIEVIFENRKGNNIYLQLKEGEEIIVDNKIFQNDVFSEISRLKPSKIDVISSDEIKVMFEGQKLNEIHFLKDKAIISSIKGKPREMRYPFKSQIVSVIRGLKLAPYLVFFRVSCISKLALDRWEQTKSIEAIQSIKLNDDENIVNEKVEKKISISKVISNDVKTSIINEEEIPIIQKPILKVKMKSKGKTSSLDAFIK